MDSEFWHDKWENKKIGFHEPDGNSLFKNYFKDLNLKTGACVFLPLCGKTHDIARLLDQGYRIKGCELSELAIQELFDELQLTPDISKASDLKIYRAANIEIFVGNFFDLTADLLGAIDAVYDRAAYVALPPEMRKSYSEHLITISKQAPIFLITYEYDQSQTDGPPFSISDQEIQDRYAASYHVTKKTIICLIKGLRKNCPATETVWVLEGN
ncbi:MAG: thiopurine S-methyltransferase [Methylocystaceae bacterium]|nr:thiopurine S-methyltransferase [Methylocystaceae bacterium]